MVPLTWSASWRRCARRVTPELGLRRDRADAGDLLLDRLDVGHARNRAPAAAAAAAEALAGADLEDVGAEAGDLLGDRRGRAVAERHHRHHRGDADDDAEHGQERAQQVPPDLAQGEDDGGERTSGGDPVRSSTSARPARRGNGRCVRA